jgi:uncharacterized membrane-anchored protein
MGLIIFLWVVFAGCWLWLLVRVFSASGFLAGALTFICWPVAIIDTIKHWNDPPNSVARPFFATLLAFAALYTFALRGAAAFLAEHEAMLAKSGGVGQFQDDEDPVAAEIRLRQAVDRLQVQRGEISIAQAHATLAIPEHFRLVPRRSLDALIAELGGESLHPDVFGWLVHDSVHLADDDAWFVEVSYSRIGHVAASDPGELGDPGLAEEARTLTTEYADNYAFEDFVHAPQWRDDIATLTWGEAIRYSDEGSDETLIDCYAAKPTREGLIEYVVEYVDPKRGELCLRSVRLMAALTRFDAGWAWDDYSFWRDKRSGHALTDVVTRGAYTDYAVEE